MTTVHVQRQFCNDVCGSACVMFHAGQYKYFVYVFDLDFDMYIGFHIMFAIFKHDFCFCFSLCIFFSLNFYWIFNCFGTFIPVWHHSAFQPSDVHDI